MPPELSYWSQTKITGELLRRELSRAAAKHARGRLVDLGCGAKPYEALFTPHVASYFGVDSKDTRGGHYDGSTAADHYADCTDTKLAAGSFDTLLSTQVIEHVLDTRKYIAECRRLLADGGVGIFSIPFLWQCHAEPKDYYRFTRHAISELFAAQGFKILELRPAGGAYAALLQTKIISVYCRPSDSLVFRALRKVFNLAAIPWLNWKGLHLDGLFWNDKLCLNYVLVARKEGA